MLKAIEISLQSHNITFPLSLVYYKIFVFDLIEYKVINRLKKTFTYNFVLRK